MRNRKKYGSLALALALCAGLAACSGVEELADDVAGNDWRTTGIVRDSGSITRDGTDTDILVCIYDDSAGFYYDSPEHVLYDSVDYPVTLSGDPWASFQSIDFADRNEDGNGDVAMLFDINGETALMVWYWDTGADAFVFQAEESYLPAGAGEAAQG